jgi:hypothetical protein
VNFAIFIKVMFLCFYDDDAINVSFVFAKSIAPITVAVLSWTARSLRLRILVWSWRFFPYYVVLSWYGPALLSMQRHQTSRVLVILELMSVGTD